MTVDKTDYGKSDPIHFKGTDVVTVDEWPKFWYGMYYCQGSYSRN